MPDKNEFIYKVTRRRNRPVYGAWSPTGQQVKLVTRRALTMMIANERSSSTYNITKVERAKIGDYEDVSKDFIKIEEDVEDEVPDYWTT